MLLCCREGQQAAELDQLVMLRGDVPRICGPVESIEG